MRGADRTWALVVGIDAYDHVKTLTGAARDAVDVVAWLRRLGVPDDQVLLHAAPAPATQKAVAGLGITVNGCREPDLWQSFARLSEVSGSKLLVFLMGHGLFEPGGERVFLTQEASPTFVKNLGIEWYAAFLRGQDFPEQYLVMDGCLNLPYTAAERSKFVAGEQAGVALPPPRADVRQVFCFSAQQGERAQEIDGHGLFTRTLLATLDPDEPNTQCVDIDETTGIVRLDLARAVNDVVAPCVTARVPRQHPGFQPLGAVSTPSVLPIVELVPESTARVRVLVDPGTAVGGVRRITLWSESNAWRCTQPRAPQTTAPAVFETLLPAGLDVVARCAVLPGGAWMQPALQEFVADGEQDIVFSLTAQPPLPADVEEVALDTVSLEGADTPAMTLAAEQEVMRALESEDLTFSFDAAKSADLTVRFRRNGPVLHATGARHITLDDLSSRVARRLDTVLPSQVTVRVRPTRRRNAKPTPPAAMPERPTSLRFGLTLADARRLGGFLLDEPVVTFRGETWTLGQLAARPEVPVDPGPVTVRVALPWGTWNTRVRARPDSATPVELPRRVGEPPLRVLRLRSGARAGRLAARGDAGPPRAVLTADSRTTPRFLTVGGVPLPQGDGTADEIFTGRLWRCEEAGPAWRTLAEVSSSRGRLRFPLSEAGPVAIQLGRAPRAEPLSLLASPAWDALVSSGRLEESAAEEAVALTDQMQADQMQADQKRADPVLGLAGAYGCLARRLHDHLEVVLGNLEKLHPDLPDLAVLQGALDRQLGRRRPATRRALQRLQADGAHPLLRWGVTFGQLAAEHYGLLHLTHRLSRLEGQVEPASTWTLWRVGERD